MPARIAADGILILHALFILFAVFGACGALRWRWMPWIHLPAAGWAAGIEISGGICPLTALENHWRAAAGQAGYAGGFVEHYLVAILYPAGLTRELQWALAALVIVVNIALYAWVWTKRRHPAGSPASAQGR